MDTKDMMPPLGYDVWPLRQIIKDKAYADKVWREIMNGERRNYTISIDRDEMPARWDRVFILK